MHAVVQYVCLYREYKSKFKENHCKQFLSYFLALFSAFRTSEAIREIIVISKYLEAWFLNFGRNQMNITKFLKLFLSELKLWYTYHI